jgi:hypothetical protein
MPDRRALRRTEAELAGDPLAAKLALFGRLAAGEPVLHERIPAGRCRSRAAAAVLGAVVLAAIPVTAAFAPGPCVTRVPGGHRIPLYEACRNR